MDDEAALLARHVALAASAWFNAPSDVEAYRRLADAVAKWNAYCAPHLEEPVVELLDNLVHRTSPQILGDAVADLEVTLRRAAREAL